MWTAWVGILTRNLFFVNSQRFNKWYKCFTKIKGNSHKTGRWLANWIGTTRREGFCPTKWRCFYEENLEAENKCSLLRGRWLELRASLLWVRATKAWWCGNATLESPEEREWPLHTTQIVGIVDGHKLDVCYDRMKGRLLKHGRETRWEVPSRFYKSTTIYRPYQLTRSVATCNPTMTSSRPIITL